MFEKFLMPENSCLAVNLSSKIDNYEKFYKENIGDKNIFYDKIGRAHV